MSRSEPVPERFENRAAASVFTVFLLGLLGATPAARVAAQPFTPDAHTLLLLHCDQSVAGAQGEAPTVARGLACAPATFGAGLTLAPGAELRYARTENLAGQTGTLEFWFRPAWNGHDGQGHVALACGG